MPICRKLGMDSDCGTSGSDSHSDSHHAIVTTSYWIEVYPGSNFFVIVYKIDIILATLIDIKPKNNFPIVMLACTSRCRWPLNWAWSHGRMDRCSWHRLRRGAGSWIGGMSIRTTPVHGGSPWVPCERRRSWMPRGRGSRSEWGWSSEWALSRRWAMESLRRRRCGDTARPAQTKQHSHKAWYNG